MIWRVTTRGTGLHRSRPAKIDNGGFMTSVHHRGWRGLLMLLVTVAVVNCAQAADRKRIVRPEAAPVLSGRVTDAQSGDPVFEVIVRVQGKRATADRDGNFTVAGVAAGNATVDFTRWGYDPVSRIVQINPGANTLNVTMPPRPVVTVTHINGSTYKLDYDGANVVYRAPIGSYIPMIPVDLCRADGTAVLVEKSQIASFVGPARYVENSPCCPTSRAIQLGVVLKNGETFTGLLPECKYYRIDFQGRDRQTGEWRNLVFEELSRVDFPTP